MIELEHGGLDENEIHAIIGNHACMYMCTSDDNPAIFRC